MIAPMEAVVADPPSPSSLLSSSSSSESEGGRWQCLASRDGSLIIAGDFMTQSSFLGCVGSADAAARAVLERIASSREQVLEKEEEEEEEEKEEEEMNEMAYCIFELSTTFLRFLSK